MSKPAGRNNSKIITRNQGGGDKKQGLAPLATQFFISQANNVQYRTESGDGRSRDLVICVNQLGGIGRGRSQFRGNADGKRGTGCDDFETFKTYLREINHYIQSTALPNAFTANSIAKDSYNVISNYKLCLVGNSESLISDIHANGDSTEYTIISNQGFGKTNNNRLFTHLLSAPPEKHPGGPSIITDPLKFSYWNGNNWSSSDTSIINVKAIQKEITWCNNYIKTYSSTSDLFTSPSTLNKFGYHTLGLINNNVTFSNENATEFLQNLSGGTGYGVKKVFYPPTNSPISDNNINIFTSTYTGNIYITFQDTIALLFFEPIFNANKIEFNYVIPYNFYYDNIFRSRESYPLEVEITEFKSVTSLKSNPPSDILFSSTFYFLNATQNASYNALKTFIETCFNSATYLAENGATYPAENGVTYYIVPNKQYFVRRIYNDGLYNDGLYLFIKPPSSVRLYNDEVYITFLNQTPILFFKSNYFDLTKFNIAEMTTIDEVQTFETLDSYDGNNPLQNDFPNLTDDNYSQFGFKLQPINTIDGLDPYNWLTDWLRINSGMISSDGITYYSVRTYRIINKRLMLLPDI